jgi:hypothetical protein
MFYDENWKLLLKNHPLIASKIEELRCEVLSYEQYEEEQEELNAKIEKQNVEINRLRRQVNILSELNGKRPIKKEA